LQSFKGRLMSEQFNARVITQEKILFEGNVESVVAPAVDGQLGILSKHAPLMAALGKGVLKIRSQGKKIYFAVFGGFLQVKENRLIVLVDKATSASNLDLEELEGKLAELNTTLQAGTVKGKERESLSRELDILRVNYHAARLANE